MLTEDCVSSYSPKQCPSLRYSSSQSFVFYFYKSHGSYTHYYDDDIHCNHSYRSLSEHIPWREFNYELPDAIVDTFQSRDWLTDSYSISSSLPHKNVILHLWEERALSSSKLWTCRVKRSKRTGEGVERGREEKEGRRKGREGGEGGGGGESSLSMCRIGEGHLALHRWA